ncbi:mast cell protease 4-like [Daphnia pulicaria]|uniref:mast cell protease 4-like n=1 Tax=Daphnia pulicaria TaxID=35523 RepID=UPI001EE9D599|nr:mast cell protease 4-like [Daphnia pulicaria]
MMSNCQVIYWLVLASACLINANSVADRSDADDEGVDEIIGGTTVARGQHQYMAYLRSFYASWPPGSYGGCGGTVITNRYILTAAHCVQDHKTGEIANKVEVRLKVYTIRPMDSGAKLITVTGSDIKPHPLFYRNGVPNSIYDIALIKLTADLPTSDYYLIGNLYMPGVDQTYVTAVGWGYTSSTGPGSSTLKQVSFRIGTNDECKNFWGVRYNHEFQLCGVVPGKSVCSGDSGGPIVRYSSAYQTYSQVGISSFVPTSNGQAACEMGYAVFTRPSAHLGWINANSCGEGGFCPPLLYA